MASVTSAPGSNTDPAASDKVTVTLRTEGDAGAGGAGPSGQRTTVVTAMVHREDAHSHRHGRDSPTQQPAAMVSLILHTKSLTNLDFVLTFPTNYFVRKDTH